MGLENKKITIGGGKIGLFGGVFLIFLFLKLGEIGVVAKWSWWWVTSPLWAPFAIFIGLVILWLFLKFVILLIEAYGDYRRQKRRNKRNLPWEDTIEDTPVKRKSRFQQKLDSLPKPKSWRP